MTSVAAAGADVGSAPDPEPAEPRRPPARLSFWVPAAAVAALFVAHLLLTQWVSGPVLSDGTGYLANARWIAGRGTSFLGPMAFYHPGWPLLLAPLFWVVERPQAIYESALVLNAALASASLLVYLALGRALGLRPVTALLAAVAAATYPAVLLQSTIEWSESLFQLLAALLVLAFHRLVTHPTVASAVAAGALAPALYATHPRGLGVVPVVAVGLLVLARAQMLPGRAAAAGVAVLIAGFMAVRLLNAALLDAMWPPDRPLSEGDVLSRLTDLDLVGNTAIRVVGQLWYVVVASAGTVIGAVWVLADRARGGRGRRVQAFALLTLAAVTATLGASSLMMADGTRVDHLVYGRYNEGFLPALLVIGAVGLSALRERFRLLAAAGIAVGTASALGLATVALNGGDRFTGDVAPVNVLGLLVWSGAHDRVSVLGVTAGALVVALVVLAARARSARASLVVLATFFLVSATVVRNDDLRPWSRYWSSVHHLPEAVRALPADGEPVAFVPDRYTPEASNFYQFQLLGRPVAIWRDGPPPAQLVVTPRAAGAPVPGSRLVYVDSPPDNAFAEALWSLPGPLQDRLATGGYLFGDDPLAPLPAAATAGEIDPPRQLSVTRGEQNIRGIEVRHTGAGSPWPNLRLAGDRLGAVRLKAVWPDGRIDIGDLPEVLLPGRRTTVPVFFLQPPGQPGSYAVDLQLVQDGIGDLPIAATVTIVVR